MSKQKARMKKISFKQTHIVPLHYYHMHNQQQRQPQLQPQLQPRRD